MKSGKNHVMTRMPDAVKQNAIAGITKTMDRIVPDEPDLRNLSYKPEQ